LNVEAKPERKAKDKLDSHKFKHMFDDLFLCMETWVVIPMLSASTPYISTPNI